DFDAILLLVAPEANRPRGLLKIWIYPLRPSQPVSVSYILCRSGEEEPNHVRIGALPSGRDQVAPMVLGSTDLWNNLCDYLPEGIAGSVTIYHEDGGVPLRAVVADILKAEDFGVELAAYRQFEFRAWIPTVTGQTTALGAEEHAVNRTYLLISEE